MTETPDLHTRLRAKITDRLELARSYPCQSSKAANSPGFVVCSCERDLRVLERHKPITPGKWTDDFGDIAVMFAPVMATTVCSHGRSGILLEFVAWPCEEITEMAGVYGIEVGERP